MGCASSSVFVNYSVCFLVIIDCFLQTKSQSSLEFHTLVPKLRLFLQDTILNETLLAIKRQLVRYVLNVRGQ